MGHFIVALEGATGYLTAETLSAFTDAFTSINVDVNSMVKVVLPIGIGIMGLFLSIRLGIRFFRSIAS